VLLVVRSPLHGVVDLPGLWLWQRLSGLLVHFLLGVYVDGAIFGAMVGFTAMVHAEQRSRCVWASASPPAMVRSSAPLVVLGGSLVESVWASFLQRPFVTLLPML
jgi:uncharacterized membrane protein required for colicin V production